MKIEEKLIVLPKKKTSNYKFQVIILEEKYYKNSYNGQILGRTLSDWVAFACNQLNVKKIQYDGKSGVLDFVKDSVNNSFDYTLILLSKTPLLQKSTIDSIIEYCSMKDCELCKLPVGYVVDNIAIKTKDINVDCLYSQNLEDFYVVENKSQYAYAEDIWQERINNFHISNGVNIIKSKSVLIEPEVDIDGGVTICSGNVLKSKTTIKKDVILKENNVIDSSIIGAESCIIGSVINSSTILDSVYISAFCEINNSQVDSECVIGGSCKINNYKIKRGTKVAPNSVLGDNDDSSCGSWKSR